MLLDEYLGEPIVRPSLASIARFEFGESYSAVTYLGKSYTFLDLDDILDVMVSEFKAGGRRATTEFSALKFRSDRPQKLAQRMLLVTAAADNDKEGRPIEYIAEQVRQAVTMYNLTQTWQHFTRENL